MADNLTVGNAPSAGEADQGGKAQESREQQAARARIDELKQRAKDKLGKSLDDKTIEAIITRREERVASAKRLEQSAQAFAAGRGKETVGNKATEHQTQAQRTAGTERARGADGLADKDRQSIRSDPKAGPRLPVTEGKPATPEQAVQILSKIFGHIEVGGQKLDLEGYAKTLKQLPPTPPKGAAQQQPSSRAAQSAPQVHTGVGGTTTSAGAARGASPTGAQRPTPLGRDASASQSATLRGGPALGAPARAPSMNVRGASASSGAERSFNAGGGLASATSFDGMSFNWDGFFANFAIKSQEDLNEWRKQMKQLQRSQDELSRVSIDTARELLKSQMTRQKQDAWGAVTTAGRNAGEVLHNLPINSALGSTDPRQIGTVLAELQTQLAGAMKNGALPNLQDPTLKDALDRLQGCGGEAAVIAALIEAQGQSGLTPEQRQAIGAEIDARLAALDGFLASVGGDVARLRGYGDRRQAMAQRVYELRDELDGRGTLGKKSPLPPLESLQAELTQDIAALSAEVSALETAVADESRTPAERDRDRERLARRSAELDAAERLNRAARGLTDARGRLASPGLPPRSRQEVEKLVQDGEGTVRMCLRNYREAQLRTSPEHEAALRDLYGVTASTPNRSRELENIRAIERQIDHLRLTLALTDRALVDHESPPPTPPAPEGVEAARQTYRESRQQLLSLPDVRDVMRQPRHRREAALEETVEAGRAAHEARASAHELSATTASDPTLAGQALGTQPAETTRAIAEEARAYIGRALTRGGEFPTLADPGYRALLERLRAAGGEAACIALLSEQLARPGLTDSQTLAIETQLEPHFAALERQLGGIGRDAEKMRGFGARRATLEQRLTELDERSYAPQPMGEARVAELAGEVGTEAVTSLHEEVTRLETAADEANLDPAERASRQQRLEAKSAELDAAITLQGVLNDLMATRQELSSLTDPAARQAAQEQLEHMEAAAGVALKQLLRAQIEAGPEELADKARGELYRGYAAAAPSERRRLRADIEAGEREKNHLRLSLAAGDRVLAQQDDPGEAPGHDASAEAFRAAHQRAKLLPDAAAWRNMAPAERQKQLASAMNLGASAASARSQYHRPGMLLRYAVGAEATAKTFDRALDVMEVTQSINNAVARAQNTVRRDAAETEAKMRQHYGRGQGMINQLAQLLAISRSR